MIKENSRKRLSGSTIAIITLSILLLASIGVGAALAYFTANADVTGNITLGNPVTIGITQGGASAESLTFSSDALPGDTFEQSIGVLAPAQMTEALMRAKLTISNEESASTSVTAQTTDSWVTGEDGYYYYNGTVTANASIDFITSITVPTSLTNDDANKMFTVNVIVETIQQANNAANSVWTTAPQDWLETYSPVAEEASLFNF